MTIRPFFIFQYIDMMEVLSIHAVNSAVWPLAAKARVSVCKSCLIWVLISWIPDVPSSVNIPWPEKGMGDADYIHAFQRIVMPIAMEFAPELVISV